MSEQGSLRNRGAVYSLQYRLVWCPKYRRKVLVGPVANDLQALLNEKAHELNVNIEALEIMPDHVQLFITAPPTKAPHYLANQFKGYTSRVLREKYVDLRSRLPSLWSRSYYIGSVGHISDETIKAFIEAQPRS